MTTADLPVVTAREGVARTSSVEVARVFGKQHKNVLRAIEQLDCSPEFNRLNFAPVEYTDAKGEKRPAFELTRDGFTFLVMGFTGQLAAQFKEAYIAAFNAMEAQVRAATVPQIPPPPAAPRRAPNEDKLLDTCLREAGKGNRAALETLVRRFGYPPQLVELQIADSYARSGQYRKMMQAREAAQRRQQEADDLAAYEQKHLLNGG